VVTDHERRLARIAIDSGADIVIGHHQHALRGAEWYRGRPIFYGLGQFVFDLSADVLRRADFDPDKLPEVDGDDRSYSGTARRRGYPYSPYHPDHRLTMVAWCRLEGVRPAEAGFLACQLQADGSVQPLSEVGAQVVDYMRLACESQALPVELDQSSTQAGSYATTAIVPRDRVG
jgi:poly-gamma-glutamate synthesis protein (capsule biosynthesis protein)